MKKLKGIIILILFISLSCGDVLPSLDYLLIVDTSGSMQNTYSKKKKKQLSIIDALKKELINFIAKVKEDDRLHIFRFDKNIELLGRIEIENEEDREKAREIIKNIKATGPWTFTLAMLARIQREAKILRAGDRQTVILIFSDGKDDPPPQNKKLNFSLPSLKKETENEYKEFKAKHLLSSLVEKDEFIYYITLNNLQNQVIDRYRV